MRFVSGEAYISGRTVVGAQVAAGLPLYFILVAHFMVTLVVTLVVTLGAPSGRPSPRVWSTLRLQSWSRVSRGLPRRQLSRNLFYTMSSLKAVDATLHPRPQVATLLLGTLAPPW